MADAPLQPGATRAEPVLVRALLAALVAGMLLAGGAVTFRIEVIRGFALVATTAALAVAGLTWPGLRGRSFAVHGMLVALAALVFWTGLRHVLASGTAGYFGTYQLGKLAAVTALATVVAARADVLSPRFVAQCLTVGLLALGAVVLAGWSAGWEGFRPPLALHYGNQNMVGSTVAAAVVLLAALALVARLEPPWSWLGPAAIVAGVAIVLGTQSRTAVFATMGGGVLLLALVPRLALGHSWRRAGLQLGGFAVVCAIAVAVAGGRLQSKVVAMVGGTAQSDVERFYFYGVALDRVTSDPVRFVAGAGLSSFARAYHGVSPQDHGAVYLKRSTDFIHNEYLEWWHDAGLVGLLLLLTVLAGTAWRLARGLASGDRAERGLAAGLLATLAAWAAMAVFTLGTRYAGAQAVLGLVLGLAWRVPPGRGIRLAGTWPALGVGVVAVAGLAAVVPYLQSERLLLESNRAMQRNDLARSTALARDAIAWRESNVHAQYALLQLASQRGDPEGARAAFEAIQAHAPHYILSDEIYAGMLSATGRFDEAFDVLQGFRRVAPYNYGSTLVLPVLGLSADDPDRAQGALLDLLRDAVAHANALHGTAHEARLELDSSGEPVLVVEPEGSALSFAIRRGEALDVLVGRSPAPGEDPRQLVADGLNRFLRLRLGLAEDATIVTVE